MALQKSLETRHGFIFPEAYIQVRYAVWTSDSSVDAMTPGVNAYADAFANQQARLDGKEPLTRFHVHFQLDLETPGNLLQQTYDSLKLLPELEGAVDV